MTTDHQPPPSVQDQLCRGRVEGLQLGLKLCSGLTGPGVSWAVHTKISPHLCFVWGHCAIAIKQSEMAATCAGFGDSQAKPSGKFSLAAASAGPGAT